MCDITIIWSKLKIISFQNFEHLTRIPPESEYEYLHLELESVLTISQKYFLIDLKPLGTLLCCLDTPDMKFPFTGKNNTLLLISLYILFAFRISHTDDHFPGIGFISGNFISTSSFTEGCTTNDEDNDAAKIKYTKWYWSEGLKLTLYFD